MFEAELSVAQAMPQDPMKPMRAAASLGTSADRAPALIPARGLSKTYVTGSGEVTALKSLDFEIYDGEFVSVVGQSGCGKSTLAQGAGRPAALHRRIGRTERQAAARADATKPRWCFNRRCCCRGAPCSTTCCCRSNSASCRWRATGRAPPIFSRWSGLSEFAQRYPFELSGGMQQRAAIVRALVQDPRLLLMDEPFGALDAMTREQMNLELMRIWSKSGKTVIFITHSIAEAIFLSDRVIAMTARPGTIADVITIDLPRPRELSVINTDRFGRYAAKLRSLLDAQGGMF